MPNLIAPYLPPKKLKNSLPDLAGSAYARWDQRRQALNQLATPMMPGMMGGMMMGGMMGGSGDPYLDFEQEQYYRQLADSKHDEQKMRGEIAQGNARIAREQELVQKQINAERLKKMYAPSRYQAMEEHINKMREVERNVNNRDAILNNTYSPDPFYRKGPIRVDSTGMVPGAGYATSERGFPVYVGGQPDSGQFGDEEGYPQPPQVPQMAGGMPFLPTVAPADAAAAAAMPSVFPSSRQQRISERRQRYLDSEARQRGFDTINRRRAEADMKAKAAAAAKAEAAAQAAAAQAAAVAQQRQATQRAVAARMAAAARQEAIAKAARDRRAASEQAWRQQQLQERARREALGSGLFGY